MIIIDEIYWYESDFFSSNLQTSFLYSVEINISKISSAFEDITSECSDTIVAEEIKYEINNACSTLILLWVL